MVGPDLVIEEQALPNALPASAQFTFGTGGTNQKFAVRGFKVCNIDSADHMFTVHHVPNGGTAANANKRFPAIAIAANTIYEIGYDENEWILKAGDALWMFADAANVVNVSLSGERQE